MRVVLILLLIATAVSALPNKVYLPVPFLCQAPYANWGEPWQDACEEATIIMAVHYFKHSPLRKAAGNQELLDLVKYQEKEWGGHYDLTADKTAQLTREYYQYKNVEVLYQFGIEDIKTELAKGNIVIAPMAGRLLRNRYYTPPGPAYHYMLFKGYDESTGEFITNDSGTKRGANFRYKYQVAFDAIHDWTGNKLTINQGKKALIVVKSQ